MALAALAACLPGVFGCGQTPKRVESAEAIHSVALVEKYLNIVLVENKHGGGLEHVLADDFSFEDPFVVESSITRGQFLGNPQTMRWIDTPKSYEVQRRFADENRVCLAYTIRVVGPSGTAGNYDVVDVFELRGDRIAKEKVYFADPVKFAKEMGFGSDYVKRFQL
jgi:hypothetical protein